MAEYDDGRGVKHFAWREEPSGLDIDRREISEAGGAEREQCRGAMVEIFYRRVTGQGERVLGDARDFSLRALRVLGRENRITRDWDGASGDHGARARSDRDILD